MRIEKKVSKDMARRGQKINEELREKILAYYATCGNMRETARKYEVSPNTVKNIVDEKPDEFERLRTNKKHEMINQIWNDMQEALDLGRQKIQLAKVAMHEFKPMIDRLIELLEEKGDVNSRDIIELIKAISSITNIPLSHISTYFGTIYDKQALMSGESTANVNHTHSYEDQLKDLVNQGRHLIENEDEKPLQ